MKSIIFNTRYQALLIIFITIIIFILHIPTHAQTSSCGSTTPARATGLVTTPKLFGQFGTTGACIIDTKASFAPFKIPTYDDLKSIYYTQSKATKSTITSLTVVADQNVYLVNGDLTIASTPSGSGTAIVFVEGNLNITSNYTYGTATTGTVFVVKGNVNINQLVTQVDAVIISQGTICTAYDGIICPATNFQTSQLVINGSLINLNETKPIKFRRTLGAANETTPSEKINHQVKYLVILRNLLSETLQKWSEISGNEPIPTQAPVTVPGAPTIGTATPGNTQATVTWTAPGFNGGSPIIGYTIIPYVDITAQPTTSVGNILTTPVTELTNGTTYTFKVRAVNLLGPGPESAASNAVTPQDPTIPPSFIAKWGSGPGTGDGQFDIPRGVAVDSGGNVYVTDQNNHRIQKFTSTGTFLTKWGVLGTLDGQFNRPWGVAVDSGGNIYIVDRLNHRIQKFR